MKKKITPKSRRLLAKTLEKSLPAEQVRYIKQPYNFSMLHGSVSKSQQKQLVLIMDYLQPKIERWLAMKAEDKFRQPSLFFWEEDAEEDLKVSIKLVDLGIDSQNYDAVRAAATSLAEQIYEYTSTNQRGERVRCYSPLFTKIVVPEKGDSRHRRDSVKIEFTFNKEVLSSDLMLMNRYSKYSRAIALHSGLYTSRLYIILNSYVFAKQKVWTVGYSELRRIVGVDEIVKHENKRHEWHNVKYPRWCDFKRRVLDSSKAELDSLAAQGLSECTFTYEAIQKTDDEKAADSMTSKDPKSVVFTIKLTEVGERTSQYRERRKKICEILASRFGFTPSDISKVNAFLYEIDEDVALKMIDDIYSSMMKRKDIVRRTNYATRALNNEILAWVESSNTPSVEDVEAEEIPGQQTIDFDHPSSPEALWDEVWDAAKDVFRGNDQRARYFGAFFFVSFVGNVLTIGSKSAGAISFYFDAVDFKPKMDEVFKRIFGEDVLVKFVVTTKKKVPDASSDVPF